MPEPIATGWACVRCPLDLVTMQLSGRTALVYCKTCKAVSEAPSGPAVDVGWTCSCGQEAVITQPPHGTLLVYCPRCHVVPAIRPNVPLTELPRSMW